MKKVMIFIGYIMYSSFGYSLEMPELIHYRGLIIDNAVNFRSQPDINSKILIRLGLGNGVEFLGEETTNHGVKWSKVRTDLCLDSACSEEKSVGWIAKKFSVPYAEMKPVDKVDPKKFIAYAGDWQGNFDLKANGTAIYSSFPYYCVQNYEECKAGKFSDEKLEKICYGKGYSFKDSMCFREVKMYRLGRAVAFLTEDRLISSFIISKENEFCLSDYSMNLDSEGCFEP